ncbi:U3 small nucleolar ribonucleoprotein complex, subunit Mpp10 [Lanmaoa asiatica]|nr:U3 small nucleolar ribonucleoprotein complex, subunit Mpp10 [Lanmaoa asiatica]
MQKPQKKIDVRETPLPSLFIEGMSIDQIWQQLDLRAAHVCENLQALQGEEVEEADSGGESSDNDESEDGDDGAEMDIDDDENLWEVLSGGEEDDSSTAEGVVDLREEISDGDEDHGLPTSMLDIVRGQQKLNPSRSYSGGHSDLDDGFFDLATFNAETSEVEAKEAFKRNLDFVPDEDSTEESEVDLFGPVDDSGTGIVDGLAPTELFYNDFFEPPPRIQNRSIRLSKVRFHERVSVKKIKPVGKGMPVSSMDDEDNDEEENDFDDNSD